MCRFVVYQGQPITVDMLTTQPENSIIHQSFQSRLGEEPLNGDGFGLAWYVPALTDQPAVFRSIQPAWNDLNLQQIARVTESHLVFAHVRAATGDTDVSKANCHPFTYGRFAFMHNGSVADFYKVRRDWMRELSDDAFNQIRGQTDSELLFSVFLDALKAIPKNDDLAEAIRCVIGKCEKSRIDRNISDPNFLNLAVTDGRQTVVTRFASAETMPRSLFYAKGKRCFCRDETFLMEPASRTKASSEDAPSIVVASEPLSDQELWEEVPPGQLVRISEQGDFQVESLSV
jgi:predicted glutamine amidotransferase